MILQKELISCLLLTRINRISAFTKTFHWQRTEAVRRFLRALLKAGLL